MDELENVKNDPDLYTYDMGRFNPKPLKGNLYYETDWYKPYLDDRRRSSRRN